MLQGTIGFIRVLGKYYGVSAAPLKGEQVGATGVQLHPQSTKGTWGTPPPPPHSLRAIYTHGLFITPSQGETLGGGTRKWGGPGTPDKGCPPPSHILPPPPHCSHSAPRDAWGVGGEVTLCYGAEELCPLPAPRYGTEGCKGGSHTPVPLPRPPPGPIAHPQSPPPSA